MYSSRSGFVKEFRSVLLISVFTPLVASAGGLSNSDQSASTSAVSNAGSVANPENASTIFFNPAGMSGLSGTNLSFGAILFEIDAVGRDSQTSATRANGDLVVGDGGGDHVETFAVPNAYLTHEVNDWLDVGLGLYVPYGLGFDYGDAFAGRYIGDEIELVSYGVNPSFSVNSGEGFSLGGSINVLYADAEQRNPVDFSGIESRFSFPRGTLNDGYATLEGDDVALEFTVGVLWQATPETSLGLAARTGTEFNLKGTGTINQFPTLSANGLTQTTVSEQIEVPITIPQSLSVGLAHQWNDTLKLLAGATWAKWSDASALSVVSRETLPVAFPREQPPEEQVQSWKDTWQWRVGAVWQVAPTWSLKAGYLFDESPVTIKTRSPLTPFDDYHQVSLGAQIRDLAGDWTVDMFVARVFYEGDISIDYKTTDPLQGQTSFKSEYDVVPWTAGLQLSREF
ncbi:OmpP1/FadL family transporter [Marinobacter adhaerens]|uniref:OmpP1/FadL family transporter n=1 Tax=Marinobacter adhaerens TaxID=1033846 RepID=UPI001C58DA87|nr:TonB-dependent receptor [Marinobacter adhaerens]MBW3227653.1 outer membrane protein transport protein [Marinobacter adhaerens]